MCKTKRISKSGMVSDLDLSNFSAAFNIAFAHSAKAMQFLRKLPFPECIPNCQFQLSARSMAASTTIMFLVVSNPRQYVVLVPRQNGHLSTLPRHLNFWGLQSFYC